MNSQADMQSREDRISGYLEVVTQSLRAVSEEPKREFVREMKSHIETLVDQYRDEGRDEPTAVTDALRMIGDPASVGRTWASNWLRANEPGNFLAAFLIGAGALVAIQAINFLMTPLAASLAKEATAAHAEVWRTLLGPLGIWMFVGWSAPILAGAICGWFKPKRASAALLATGALYGAWVVVSLCRQGGGQAPAALTKDAGLSPGIILSLLAAIAIVSSVLMVAMLLTGSALARSWRIRRLTSA